MKSKEELNVIKAEAEALKNKLVELSDDELQQVTGGNTFDGQTKVGKGADDPLSFMWGFFGKIFGTARKENAQKKEHNGF